MCDLLPPPPPPPQVAGRPRGEGGAQAFHLFEDHDIATVVIVSKGEGCEACHFHHVMSGRRQKTVR